MKKLFRILALVMSVALCLGCLSACGGSKQLSGLWEVEMEIKDYGIIRMQLDADAAPITVTNFVNLVEDGFYDGLTIHRVYSGFVIQGGDPRGDGTGGSGKTIKGEFYANGVSNNLPHTRGAVSMARLGNNYNSATSQFFIVHQDSAQASLDGLYACFGYVTEGMDVVDAICRKTPVLDANGSVAPEDQPVIVYAKVVH
ncbi:MAG: peptidylprolyl isomerase [Ruminococcaceae bacterium]|nr:peptidylprolyl isomerase [Oscillospiraceae bacterium]